MTSSFDSMFSASGLGALQQHFGESVTRHAQGNTDSSATIANCIFIERGAMKDEEAGHQNVRRATLYVPSATTTTNRDSWTINGELWLTWASGATEGGMKTIELEKVEDVRTRPVRARRG